MMLPSRCETLESADHGDRMRHVHLRLLVIALPLSFLWEMLQAPAFTGLPRPWFAHAAVCSMAAVGDGLLVLALFMLGSRLFGDSHWVRPPRARRYLILVLIGILVQVGIEWVAVDRLALWGYQPGHPTVPLLGTGLLPILYAVVVVPLAFWTLARWSQAREPR
jgi:hypothetical protein